MQHRLMLESGYSTMLHNSEYWSHNYSIKGEIETICCWTFIRRDNCHAFFAETNAWLGSVLVGHIITDFGLSTEKESGTKSSKGLGIYHLKRMNGLQFGSVNDPWISIEEARLFVTG